MSVPSRPKTRRPFEFLDDLHGRRRHQGRNWRRMNEKTICTGDEVSPSESASQFFNGVHPLIVYHLDSRKAKSYS